MMMLRATGTCLVVMGIIWALQGAGWLDWPARGFMIDARQWVLYGALTAMVGALLFWWGGRISRD